MGVDKHFAGAAGAAKDVWQGQGNHPMQNFSGVTLDISCFSLKPALSDEALLGERVFVKNVIFFPNWHPLIVKPPKTF